MIKIQQISFLKSVGETELIEINPYVNHPNISHEISLSNTKAYCKIQKKNHDPYLNPKLIIFLHHGPNHSNDNIMFGRKNKEKNKDQVINHVMQEKTGEIVVNRV